MFRQGEAKRAAPIGGRPKLRLIVTLVQIFGRVEVFGATVRTLQGPTRIVSGGCKKRCELPSRGRPGKRDFLAEIRPSWIDKEIPSTPGADLSAAAFLSVAQFPFPPHVVGHSLRQG